MFACTPHRTFHGSYLQVVLFSLHHINNSGMDYVNVYANPTPPTSLPDSSDGVKMMFMIWVIAWGIIAYPFLFMFLLLVFPKIFGLPKIKDKAANAQSMWRERQSHKARNKCCGMYCGLTVVYFAVVALVLWGTLFLANAKLTQTFVLFSAEDWAGNYVIVEKSFNGSTTLLFSHQGTLLGDVLFNEVSAGWTMDINSTAENVQKFTFTNSTKDTPVFNATCRAPSTNISYSCFSGGLENEPALHTTEPGDHPAEEYDNSLNVTMSAISNSTFLNISSNVWNVWTSFEEYQGIGLKYPPLGTWYVNTTPILEVIWSVTSGRACDGLLINLSKDHEILAWPIVGMIWEWWKQWGEAGGCSWS
jgi:hypothetical protein